MNKAELLSIGGAYIDINCFNLPFDETGLYPETEVVGEAYEIIAGGSAVNFAFLSSSLEMQTTFVGKTGEDRMGRLLGELLEGAGVRASLIMERSVQTNISFNLVNESGKTIMAVAGNANQSLSSEEVLPKAIERLPECSYLLFGGCFKLRKLLPAFKELTAAAKDHDVKTVLDHGRLFNGVTPEEIETVKQLALSVDYYLPSTLELQELWNVGSIEEGLRQLKAKSAGTTVLKDGVNGAVTIIDNEIMRIPAFKVRQINPVGAGDSFNAGFIAALSSQKSIIDSIRFACATAALKISRGGLPTRKLVESFLASDHIAQ